MHPIYPCSTPALSGGGQSPGHSRHIGDGIDLAVLSGRATLDASGHATVLWLVLRGQVEVQAEEGRFVLGPRQWIALDRESAPRAVLGRHALVLAAGLGIGMQRGESGDWAHSMLLPGRGKMAPGARGLALRLWHRHAPSSVLARQRGQDAPGASELRAFLVGLQADLADGLGRCPGHSERRKRQVLLRMQRARLCLEGQAGNGLRIADLASRINFSPWYFSKVFHAVYGIGPLQFAARMRLDHAFRLLATTRLPVTEVSAACGFENPCSFARAFRARFGMTASEHRLRHAHATADASGPSTRAAWTALPSRHARGVR